MSLRIGTGQDDHHPGGRTTYRTDFTTNQVVRLLGVHFAADQLVLLLIALALSSATLGLTSYPRDSSVFGFFVQASPAKLGTPLAVGFYYILTTLHAMYVIMLLHAV